THTHSFSLHDALPISRRDEPALLVQTVNLGRSFLQEQPIPSGTSIPRLPPETRAPTAEMHLREPARVMAAPRVFARPAGSKGRRSEEHTSELPSLTNI